MDEGRNVEAGVQGANTSKKKKAGGRQRHKENVIRGEDCVIQEPVLSYYSNSQSLHTPVHSNKEEVTSNAPKYPSFNEERDFPIQFLTWVWSLKVQSI